MKGLLKAPLLLIAAVFGTVHWRAPTWLLSVWRLFKSNPRFSAVFIMVAIVFTGVFLYVKTLPGEIKIRAEVGDIIYQPKTYHDKPEGFTVRFGYDFSDLKEGQERPSGIPQVARIDLLNGEIESGITISPTIDGKWVWRNDQTLKFTPAGPWIPDTDYKVTLSDDIFIPNIRLKNNTFSFKTTPLLLTLNNIEFYQDPKNSAIRKVISTLEFNYPLNRESLKNQISLTMRPSGTGINTSPAPVDFTIEYDRLLLKAYIHSESLQLPDVSNFMTLNVASGVKSILGGPSTTDIIKDKVLIPDAANFLKVSTVTAQIVRNESNQPEQVITMEFTDDIARDELIEKTDIYLLPNYHGSKRNRLYRTGEVSNEVLLKSKKLSPKWLENERNNSSRYSLIVDVPENRPLYIRFKKGLTSVNEFYTRVTNANVVTSPLYPKEAKIVGEGSVLSNSGDHKFSVTTRGVRALRFKIGQVLDGQLSHIISQTRGDISSPIFNNWKFDKNNVSHLFEKTVRLTKSHPKEANYASFDLSEYLRRENKQYGLFFVSVHGYDESRDTYVHGAVDHRLILITDLGVIVKNSTNGDRDLFVQSIHTGEPVSGANIELLGKNGLPLQSGITNAEGHLKLSALKGFYNEKQPVVYVVNYKDDVSFIPYDRKSRQINLSRFDIGGVNPTIQSRERINAYIFSDRGIYRPGETVNLGFVVKRDNFDPVGDAPLEIIITGPRYNTLVKQKMTLPRSGFFDFQFKTESTFDTGEYAVALKILDSSSSRGSIIRTEKIRVEEFQPDTMKISSQLLGVEKKAWLTDNSVTAQIELENLFGIPAQDRLTQARMIVRPQRFSFDQYPDYRFTSKNGSSKLSLDRELKSIKTNLNGVAEYPVNLGRFKGGTYLLEFIAKGFDQAGGRSVTARNSILVSSSPFVIGHKTAGDLKYLNKGANQRVEYIAVDNTLKKIESAGLTLKIVESKKVSVLVKLRNGTYQYQSADKDYLLSEQPLDIGKTGTFINLDTAEPGDFRLDIIDKNGRELSSVKYTVVGDANLDGKIDKSSELQLTLKGSDYKPGDAIEMNIKAPYKGAGLITIESDQVHAFKWFKTENQSSIQTIKLPENIEGNAYVNVTFTRDVTSTEIFQSPLSYAVQPFSIDKSKRTIDVNIEVDEVVLPGKPMKIRYSADKKSKLVLFAIDEGILQVANYKQPKPLEYFLKKRALGVSTMQIMDLILPEFALFQSLSAAGGGAARNKALAKNLNPFSRKTDTPAVFWSGIVEADKEAQQLDFVVPNTFAGTLRIMAVAVSDEAMGAATDSTLVRGPFVLTPNVLLQAAPGDEFEATIGVANIIEGSGKQVPVNVSIKTSEHLSIIGEKEQQILIDEGGENSASFKFRVNEKLGSAEIDFLTQYKEIDSKRSVGLSVRPATPYTSDFISGFSKKGDVNINLSRQLFDPLSKQSLSASTSPLVIVDGLSDYLEHFPHGCTEQVVSKVFPIIGLTKHPLWSTENKKVVDGIDQVLLKLRQRQQGEGGFSFWPGGNNVSDYPTVYATHFLLEAKDSGFSIPQVMLDKTKNYLINYVGRKTYSMEEARIRANGIYLLTRMGVVTTNYLVELQETLETDYKNTWKKDLAASYMAATYLLLKKDTEAYSLINGYDFTKDKSKQYSDFDSSLTQDAQHLWLLARHFPKQAKALDGNLVSKFIEPIFKGRYNTIAASYSVLALGEYSRLVSDISGDKSIEIFAIADNAKAPLSVSKLPFPKANYDVDVESVQALAKQALYYLNVQTGFDSTLPTEAVSNNIEVYRTFFNQNGDKVSEIKQGDELTVSIRVRTLKGKSYHNIAVVDLLPGGFEVIRSSVSRTAYNWRADYLDVREDRVIYYGSFNSVNRELTYKVKVTAPGTFVVPPTYVESMYDRSVKAISAARSFTVLPAVK